MSRIIIFGDLHANWEAMLALQQAERRPELIFCLGDSVGYGPDPKRCLDSVRAHATHVIGGQHDLSVGTGYRTSNEELLAGTWACTQAVLSADDRRFLAGLPNTLTVEFGGVRFCLARLPPDDPQTETQMLITMSQSRLRQIFDKFSADVILLGGPHVPAMRQVGKKLIVCPGSLGQPRYGVSDPTFAAWENGRLQIHHLHYHPQDTIRKLSLLPLDPDHMLRLQSVLQTGGLV